MNRIQQLFKRKPNGVLSIFITAGFPKLDSLPEILLALEKSGVDMVEIGIPFSDPTADGPAIQHSNNVAISNGMTMEVLMEQLKNIREMVSIPLVLMGYLNPPMQYGFERLIEDASAAGIDGVILPDLPLREYETIYRKQFEQHGLVNIFLITPQTSDERIRKMDELSNAFIYVVSTNTITGGQVDFETGQRDYFSHIRDLKLKNPALVGFGIRDQHTFEIACKYLNGAIIGTAFIKTMESAEKVDAEVQSFVQSIRPGVL